jgi:LysR family transcriptional regulator, glycine cleavage system transcriptional activator
MSRRLPPLNALRAFEASARHLSFTLAADELAVTQGAVSRHVKTLEEHFDVALFVRGHRSLTLTEEGERLLPAITDAFARIARAADEVKSVAQDLRIKVSPTFAIRWLIRRLPRFENRRPDIHLRMTTAWHHVDFEREDFDAAIFSAAQPPDHLHITLISRERLAPVCAPALLQGSKPLRAPADLASHRLLHPSIDGADWRVWLATAGLDSINARDGQFFDTMDLALQAAEAGIGIAIADVMLIQSDLRAGRLVVPFPIFASGGAVWLVCPKPLARHPRIAAFREWLVEEAQAQQQGMGFTQA